MGEIVRGVDVKKRIPTAKGFGNDLIAMQIETSHGIIALPDRALTYQEFRAKTEIGSDIPIDAWIAIYGIGMLPNPLHREEILKLSDSDSQYFNRKRREALSAGGRYDQYFPIRLLTFTIAEGDKTRKEGKKRVAIPNTSGREYLDEDEDNIKNFLEAVANLTRAAEYDILTVPLISLDIDVLKRTYEWIMEKRGCFGFGDMIPTFSLKMPKGDIEELIEFIISKDKTARIEERRVNLVALQYRRSINRIAQMHELSSLFSNNNMATIVLDVERQIIEKNNLSGIHTQAHIFGQSFSVNKAVGFPSDDEENEDNTETPQWDSIKFLNTTLPALEGVYTGMAESRFKEILEEIRTFFGEDSEINVEILKEFRRRFIDRKPTGLSDEDQAILKYVRHLSRIHEFILSRREFANLRAKIMSEDVEEYINSKELLSPVLYAPT